MVPGDLSPTEDHKQFQELFKRVAQSQEIQTTDVQQKQHRLLKNLQPSQKSKLAFPFDEAILEIADDIWQPPATSLTTNKRSDKKYFISQKGMDFLFTHPQPNSLIIDAAQQRTKMSQAKNTVSDKEAKHLDVLGRKVYLTLRMCNYVAQLANHDFDNYSKLVPLFEHLSDSKHQILKAVTQEGLCATPLTKALNNVQALFHHHQRPHQHRWSCISTNWLVLDIVTSGYAIPFNSLPSLLSHPFSGTPLTRPFYNKRFPICSP